jgi:tetratricopeptide (TPR) repeat protein
MRSLLVVAATIFTTTIAHSQTDDLRDARSVLSTTETVREAGAERAPSKSAALLADISQYRLQAKSLAPEAAARRWFVLLDRAKELGTPEFGGSFDSFDYITSQGVGVPSLLAALPPPNAWLALRGEAVRRARKEPQDIDVLATRFLTEALTNDTSAMRGTLTEIQTAGAAVEPARRQQILYVVEMARSAVAKIYGSSDDIVAALLSTLEKSSELPSLPFVEVPDLVGLVGEARAAEILRKAVTSPVRLQLQAGDETRRLARRVALEEAARLRRPQWALVDSLDAAPLYEEFQQRFGNDAAPAHDFDPSRSEADVYYLLSTIVSEQHVKAEQTLITIARSGSLYLPKPAVEALQRSGRNEALFKFLHAMLPKHPDLQAWSLYIEQASYTGHSDQALAMIRELLARKNLNAHVRGELLRYEAQALLAANRIDEGLTQMRRQLAGTPKANDPSLLATTQTAVRLAEIGRLLKREELLTVGLKYAEAATALDVEALRYQRSDLIQRMLAIYRRAGRPAVAQALAIRELSRESEADPRLEELGIPEPSAEKRMALIELVGLYSAAGRQADVLTVLNESRHWGARDLGELVEQKDSLGMPVGLGAARALAATANGESATKVLRELLDRLPGYDPAYALFTELTGDRAVSELETLYANDQFEERPLIWKAQVLAARGSLDEAERTSRAAIGIDPSDGEQGRQDRLRAYAVLAQILDARGDSANAALYRSAIEAIRVSENADEFYAVGLYDRAFALYRDALNRFSDAYCIQSRLAIQLTSQGRHSEATAHYRRAYELMPESFGRVESHCFGCESVFRDSEAQGVAEEVFTRAIRRDAQKPQSRYLLGYLRQEQGRYGEALQEFRAAVALDNQYLNAWKHLHDLGDRTYIDSAERDIARLKLLQLDPRQRHVSYDLRSVGNLTSLWNELERVATPGPSDRGKIYRLANSATRHDDAVAKLPPEMRMQMQQFEAAMEASRSETSAVLNPQLAIARHVIVGFTKQLMGGPSAMGY